VECVATPGARRLRRLLWLVLPGDPFYLAIVRGADPVDIEAIRRLNAELSRR
jgi:hypothetical protein